MTDLRHGTLVGKVKSLKLWVVWLTLLVIALVFAIIIWHSKTYETGFAASIDRVVPLASLESAALTTLVIGLIFNWWIRREATSELHRDLFSTHVVENVLSDERLAEIVPAAVARMLRDKQLGDDVCALLLRQGGLMHSHRRYNVQYQLNLSSIPEVTGRIQTRFFRLFYDVQFERSLPEEVLYFVCVDSGDAYNRLMSNPRVEWVWSTERTPAFQDLNEEFYRLESFEIDGEQISDSLIEGIPGTNDLSFAGLGLRQGDVIYRVRVPQQYRRGDRHRVRYRLLVHVQRFAHVVSVPIREPSKGVQYTLDYAKTDIYHMNVMDVLTTKTRPEITFHPPNDSHMVSVRVPDEWVLPKSGIVFVWVLNLERTGEVDAMVRTAMIRDAASR